MKIQTFKITAKVSGGNVSLDHATRKPSDEVEPEIFDDSRLVLKSQEIAQNNKDEQEIVKTMGDGEYTIDFKIIV